MSIRENSLKDAPSQQKKLNKYGEDAVNGAALPAGVEVGKEPLEIVWSPYFVETVPMMKSLLD